MSDVVYVPLKFWFCESLKPSLPYVIPVSVLRPDGTLKDEQMECSPWVQNRQIQYNFNKYLNALFDKEKKPIKITTTRVID